MSERICAKCDEPLDALAWIILIDARDETFACSSHLTDVIADWIYDNGVEYKIRAYRIGHKP